MVIHIRGVGAAFFMLLASGLPGAAQEAAVPSGFRPAPIGVARHAASDTTPPKKRPKAVELPDEYATLLAIHKWASYSTIPLFAAQAIVGQQLFVADQAGNRPSQGLRVEHDLLALGLGGLFAVNTVTGSLTWWETRSQPGGRTWRTIHSALMLASGAGFAYTAALGSNARHLEADRILHKNWAIGSASVALVSYAMMLWPIRRD
jgi:hypothetical protein